MEDLESIITQIQKASGLTEVARVTTFEGYHETAGKVEIRVRDRGVPGPHRYSVFAQSVDFPGKTATGNSEAELDTAIATAHWFNLDGK